MSDQKQTELERLIKSTKIVEVLNSQREGLNEGLILEIEGLSEGLKPAMFTFRLDNLTVEIIDKSY